MAAAASRWKVGDKVMALYEDDNWYRAEVLGVDVAEGQTVYLIGVCTHSRPLARSHAQPFAPILSRAPPQGYEDSDKQEYLYEASVEARGAVKDAGDEADAKEREQASGARRAARSLALTPAWAAPCRPRTLRRRRRRRARRSEGRATRRCRRGCE
jgi:hypothetical protein